MADSIGEGAASAGLKEVWEFNLSDYKVSEEGMKKVNALRSAAKAMANAYIDIVPPGRDQAIALTHLEDSLFHAVAGISRSYREENNQESEK